MSKRALFDLTSDEAQDQSVKRHKLAQAAENRAWDPAKDRVWRQYRDDIRRTHRQAVDDSRWSLGQLNQARGDLAHQRAVTHRAEVDEDVPGQPGTTDRADAREEREDATVDEADAAADLRDAEEVAAHYDDVRTELRRHEGLLDNPVYRRPSLAYRGLTAGEDWVRRLDAQGNTLDYVHSVDYL
jgi:hypothetical protein